MEPSDKTLFQSVIKMIDSLSAAENYDAIIHILSLLCLFSVLNQTPSAAPAISNRQPHASNPLQGLLGDLMKNAGGGSPLGGALGAALGSPDLLSSLLPLLNNPQIKSKLNPANIASVMGMINNLGGIGGLAGAAASLSNMKAAPEKSKPEEKKTAADTAPPPAATLAKPPQTETSAAEKTQPKAAAEPEALPVVPDAPPQPPDGHEPAAASRFLKWKTKF